MYFFADASSMNGFIASSVDSVDGQPQQLKPRVRAVDPSSHPILDLFRKPHKSYPF